eukprot:6327162-Amphidinium_carterae.1
MRQCQELVPIVDTNAVMSLTRLYEVVCGRPPGSYPQTIGMGPKLLKNRVKTGGLRVLIGAGRGLKSVPELRCQSYSTYVRPSDRDPGIAPHPQTIGNKTQLLVRGLPSSRSCNCR